MKRYLSVLLALVAVACWLPGQAAASPITVLCEQTLSSAVAGDLVSNPDPGAWADSSDGFKIHSLVTMDGSPFPGLPVHYQYFITNAAGGDLSRELSHIIIQVSDDATAADFSAGILDTYTNTSQGNSNPGLPTPPGIFGLKFNADGAAQFTVDFYSDRLPVQGNFYAKDGSTTGPPPHDDIFVYNTGLTGVGDGFICTPDTAVVPLPPSVLLLGSGLLGLGVLRFRKA
ncbi:MAG: hypothetical protein WC600_06195 [Desulfobaccales bacterium]